MFKKIPPLPRKRPQAEESRSDQAVKGDRIISWPVMGLKEMFLFLIRRVLLSAAGALLVFHAALLVIAFSAALLLAFVNPPLGTLEMERLLTEGTAPAPRRFVPLNRIPGYARAMFVRLEDKNFYSHNGVDPGAILYAYSQNKRYKRVIMGGSTITQQLARTLFLTPDRNYLRKYAEVIFAVVLDTVLSKDRILELYLNSIEWGKGVFGIDAASRRYFRKPAEKLSVDEAARLAAIIINPLDFNVDNFFAQPAMRARYYALVGQPEDTTEKDESGTIAAPDEAQQDAQPAEPDTVPGENSEPKTTEDNGAAAEENSGNETAG